MTTTENSIEQIMKLYEAYTDSVRSASRQAPLQITRSIEDRLEQENPFYTRLQTLNYGR